MKLFSRLLVLASAVSSLGAIAPEYSKEAQDNSEEQLFITAHHVAFDTVISDGQYPDTSITASVKATVEDVVRTKNGLAIGDTISFNYGYTLGNIGGIDGTIIHQGEYVPAYLNIVSGTTYKLGAGNSSFHFIHLDSEDPNDTYGNNTSLVWYDNLWNASFNTSLSGSIELGKYAVKEEMNNLLFYQDDSLTMRCFIDNDTLYVSPKQRMESSMDRGVISPNGATISFHLLNETMNELQFQYTTTYSCSFGEYINLYEHNLEIRTLSYNAEDGRTHLGVLDPLVYGSYRNIFISPGTNSVIMHNGKEFTIESDTVTMSYTVTSASDIILTEEQVDSLNSPKTLNLNYYPVVIDSNKVVVDSVVGNSAFIRIEDMDYLPTRAVQTGELSQSIEVREGDTLKVSGETEVSAEDVALFLIKTIFTGAKKDGETVLYVEIVSLRKKALPTSLITTPSAKISLPKEKQLISIYSANGRLVHKAEVSYSEVGSMLQNSNLSQGVYFLKTPHFNRSFIMK